MSGSWKPSTGQRKGAASPWRKSKADGWTLTSVRELNSPEEPSSTTSSIFEYHLKPEFDFEQEIFSNMDTMEVLEPQWLREEVSERLRNLAKKYKICTAS